MAGDVEFTDEFEAWWHTLSESEQGKVDGRISLRMERGPNLGFPFSSQVKTSRFPERRELRAQAGGDPLRMLDAFDPRRTAILLAAGDKTGDDRWYETNVPVRHFECLVLFKNLIRRNFHTQLSDPEHLHFSQSRLAKVKPPGMRIYQPNMPHAPRQALLQLVANLTEPVIG